MDKEEIMKKVKIDNKKGDEREKFIEVRSEVYAVIVTVILLLAFIIVSVFRKTDILGFLTVMLGGVFGEFIGKVRYNRNFSNICSAIISGILFIWGLIEFFMGNSLIININL